SAAAKAGLKPHDVLLEFNGKPVPNETGKLREIVEEVKAGTSVDAGVLRKGKKETIKGITLGASKKPTMQRFGLSGYTEGGRRVWYLHAGRPLARAQPFFSYSGAGRHNVMTTIFRDAERFTTRHQEGSLIITVTGTVADGKTKVSQIEIQDGEKRETDERLDKA